MAKNLRIVGLVQGVGYRYSFHAQARALHLSGWVRNRIDGSVDASVSGNSEALKKIVDWAWQGPVGAQVTEVSVAEVDDALLPQGRFEIWPTE
jgi:acylphosphatase